MRSVVVLGMHRSGTSAITRALQLLGGSLGPEDDLGEYWEPKPMRRVNEQLLEALGGAWDCPPPLPDGWERSDAALSLRDDAAAAIARFADPPVLVWKDPRTCLTLPFWRVPLGGDPIVVLIHRHPEEVAQSLETRNDLGLGLSLALWERYNSAALTGALGLRTTVISYPRLVEDPHGVMRALVETLGAWGVQLGRDPEETDMELSPSRRHHSSERGLDHPALTAPQRDLLALLEASGGVHERFALPGPLPEPEPLSLELIEMQRRLRSARHELRRARTDLRRLMGSRRRLLRALLHPGAHGPGRD